MTGAAQRWPDAGKADEEHADASSLSESGIPCPVARVLSEHCAGCHGDELGFGAKFSLTRLSDFHAPAPSAPERKIRELVSERVGLLDSPRRMPPPSMPALSASDLTTLRRWIEAGAEASGESCRVQAPGARSAGDGGLSLGGSGGARKEAIDYRDPELECYRFTSHAPTDKTKPYSVPTTPDIYVDFTVDAPWQGDRYIRSFRNIVDNKQAIHHWILYKNHDALPEGVADGIGAHPEAERLFGWAPGSDDLYFDPDVGMKAEGDVSYTLEAHFNNTTGAPTPDASGVEVCVTPKKPTHEVAEHWVGTELIVNDTKVTGTCTPKNEEPVHIIAAHPHMHVKGKHMKVVIQRKDGGVETAYDRAFDFAYQRSYLLDLTIYPGDVIKTTCTYSEPAIFGLGTNDEMCFFFPIAWPAGALVSDTLFGGLHGANTCLD